MMLRELGEFGFIARRAARLENRGGVLTGIGDDAAILASLQMPVVTCDALIENVHFRRDWSTPFLLGRKAMSVNVSDLAAKGARPVAAFVSLGVSTQLAQSPDALGWLDALYEGFEDAARQYNFTVAGGDTVRTENEIMISVTLIGDVSTQARGNGAPFLRSGAHVGHAVLATGTLGDSAAGLFLLQHPEIEMADEARAYLIARHLDPTARLNEAEEIWSTPDVSTPVVSAALDLSDGLTGDAAHIAAASRVQIEIDVAALPLSPACRAAALAARENGFNVSAQNWALHGGEDYELLWCVAPERVASLSQAMARATSTPVTVVGHCVGADEVTFRANPVILIQENGERETASDAWTHF